MDGSIPPPFRFLPHNTTPNNDYLTWSQNDQLILNALISSLSDNLIVQVVGYSTSREIWATLEHMFTTKSHACIIQLSYQLSTISKGSNSIIDYYSKVKHLSNTTSAAGSPLSSSEFISYLLVGLNNDFDALVTSVTIKLEPLTPEEIYALLLTHKNCISHSNHIPHSTNFFSQFHYQFLPSWSWL